MEIRSLIWKFHVEGLGSNGMMLNSTSNLQKWNVNVQIGLKWSSLWYCYGIVWMQYQILASLRNGELQDGLNKSQM